MVAEKKKTSFSEQFSVNVRGSIMASYPQNSSLEELHHFAGFHGPVEKIRFFSNGVPFTVITSFTKEKFLLKLFFGHKPAEYYKNNEETKWSKNNSRNSNPWILQFDHEKEQEVWLDTSLPVEHERAEEIRSVVNRITKDLLNIRRLLINP